MKSISMLKTLLALALLADPAATRAQQPAAPTAAGLQKSFARIASGTEGESDAFDQLVVKTARQLVAYLKTHDLTTAQAKQLRLNLTDYSPGHDEKLLPEWGRPTSKYLALKFTQGRFAKVR